MKRVNITEKDGNLNIVFLTNLTELDYEHCVQIKPMPINYITQRQIVLNELTISDIEITKSAIEAMLCSPEDFDTNKNSSYLIMSDNTLTVYYKEKDDSTIRSNAYSKKISITIERGKFGYCKDNGLFDKIVKNNKIKETINAF
jgi:hypothetical protein